MFHGIIFDLDGLMIDTESMYFDHFSAKLATLDITLTPKVFRGQMGTNLVDGANHIIREFNLTMKTEEMIALLGMRNFQSQIIQGLIPLMPMPGLMDLISFFHGKLALGIATGSSVAMVNYAVKKLNLTSQISVMVSSEEVVHGKPAPDSYLEAARRMNLSPSTCIVLEDAPNGVMAGKAAGCFVIAVPSKWTKDFDFQQADLVCDSLNEAHIAIAELCHLKP